jgi:hypothetical protein
MCPTALAVVRGQANLRPTKDQRIRCAPEGNARAQAGEHVHGLVCVSPQRGVLT